MAIEFSCPHCEAVLRTPEDRAGLSGRCPSCGDPIWIPYARQPGADDQPSAGSRTSAGTESQDAQPPFAADFPPRTEDTTSPTWICGACGEENPVDRSVCLHCGQSSRRAKRPPRPPKVGIQEILSETSHLFSNYAGVCVLAALIDIGLTVTGLLIVLIISAICGMMLAGQQGLGQVAFLGLLSVGSIVVLSILAAGHLRFFLALARKQPIPVWEMFFWDRTVGWLAIAGIAFWGMAVTGFVIFLIPGILVMLLFWPNGRLIVDQNLRPGAALIESYRLTSANLALSFWVFLVHLLILLAAGFIPIVGQLLAVPFASILHSVTYLAMTGEFTPDERYRSNL